MRSATRLAGEERPRSLLTRRPQRFLLCEPRHFAVEDEANPWMDRAVQPRRERVLAQWEGLVRAMTSLGARVEVMPAVAGLPDMVFTRDACVAIDGRFVRARFRHPARRAEAEHVAGWLGRRDVPADELDLPADQYLEGGDVCVLGGHVLAGWGFRSSRAAHAALGELLGVTVHSLRLVDPRYYHLDLCVCPLDGAHALVAPDTLDPAGRRLLREIVPEPIELRADEVAAFCANAIVVGKTVVMSQCPPRLAGVLAEHGFGVRCAPVAEFKKGGGAVSCLTLPLDRTTRAAK